MFSPSVIEADTCISDNFCHNFYNFLHKNMERMNKKLYNV